jgi:HK97 family phage major capsid protein
VIGAERWSATAWATSGVTEEQAFLTGTGAGQPLGVFTASPGHQHRPRRQHRQHHDRT